MLTGVDAAGPVIRVSNLVEGIAFFEKIGFTTNFKWGDPPFYAVMVLAHNDTYSLHLSQREDVAPDGVGLYFISEDVDAIYATALSLGLPVIHPLADQDYGMRDFAVQGPDKIHVAVGKAI